MIESSIYETALEMLTPVSELSNLSSIRTQEYYIFTTVHELYENLIKSSKSGECLTVHVTDPNDYRNKDYSSFQTIYTEIQLSKMNAFNFVFDNRDITLDRTLSVIKSLGYRSMKNVMNKSRFNKYSGSVSFNVLVWEDVKQGQILISLMTG